MAPFLLPPRCDLATVKSLHGELVTLAGSNVLEIDGTAVTFASQALLQLLVSARKSIAGATITPSETLATASRIAGLSQELFDEEK
jgi:anti-anti-sigma regulatory factor